MEAPITFESTKTQRLTHAYMLCLLRCAYNEPGSLQYLEVLKRRFTKEQREILDILATEHARMWIMLNPDDTIDTYEQAWWRQLDNYPLGDNPDSV